MPKPIPITFTGIDERTDPRRLADIQARHPNAEFGILFRDRPTKNEYRQKRFPSAEVIDRFIDAGLRLSLHVCGPLSRRTFLDGFRELVYLLRRLPNFKRIQLNGLGGLLADDECCQALSIPAGMELILQQHPGEKPLVERIERINGAGTVSILIDASGGRGLDVPFTPVTYGSLRTGYAGGINPDNAAAKARALLDQGARDFWLDCETGIRTDDWFDADKAEQILRNLDTLSLP